jgi:Kef-type K+ transport system membrane component KefB
MKRVLIIYGLISVVFAAGIIGILYYGDTIFGTAGVTQAVADTSAWSALKENLSEPLGRLLLQVIAIVIATRIVGLLFAKLGQPTVVGEITAGILLGPSLFGWLWPDAFQFLFAKPYLGVLQLFAQIGVCVFMFVVGLELDVGTLKKRAHTALVVSHASIMVPYLLGVASALLLYESFAAPGSSFISFALFMGIAMSITAFPVLARILKDRGIEKTPLGATAITCAAVGDATAWAILAFVVAMARATGLVSTLVELGLVVVFVIIMLWGVRPLLARWFAGEKAHGGMARGVVAGVLLFMTASALTTQVIGIHALFGAFLAGVVMPRNKEFHEYLTLRIENFSSIFLLPLFFAFSGLRTQIGLLDDVNSWLVCLGIIAVAIVGKLVGSMVPARLTGMSWHEAFSLGALMNTRGLVELIALNIGYDLGILPPRIFSMMVLMAVVTTFMAGPLLDLADAASRRKMPKEAVKT